MHLEIWFEKGKNGISPSPFSSRPARPSPPRAPLSPLPGPRPSRPFLPPFPLLSLPCGTCRSDPSPSPQLLSRPTAVVKEPPAPCSPLPPRTLSTPRLALLWNSSAQAAFPHSLFHSSLASALLAARSNHRKNDAGPPCSNR